MTFVLLVETVFWESFMSVLYPPIYLPIYCCSKPIHFSSCFTPTTCWLILVIVWRCSFASFSFSFTLFVSHTSTRGHTSLVCGGLSQFDSGTPWSNRQTYSLICACFSLRYIFSLTYEHICKRNSFGQLGVGCERERKPICMYQLISFFYVEMRVCMCRGGCKTMYFKAYSVGTRIWCV